jgi:hypothetical protein
LTPGSQLAPAHLGFGDWHRQVLFAGGVLTTTGRLPSSRIAAWECLPTAILADRFESGDNTAGSSATLP